jgi:hypothetical protein
MAISDRLTGKKNTNGNPHIEALHPGAALPGGEVRIVGRSLRPQEFRQPRVRIGEVDSWQLGEFNSLTHQFTNSPTAGNQSQSIQPPPTTASPS